MIALQLLELQRADISSGRYKLFVYKTLEVLIGLRMVGIFKVSVETVT